MEEITEKAPRERTSWVKNSLLAGLLGAVVVFCAWFIVSRTVKSVGLAILLTAIGVFAVEVIAGLLIRKLNKPLRACVSVVLAVICALAFFSATVYTFAPTQLFNPHFDEESYNELLEFNKAEELIFETEDGALCGWMLHTAEDGAPLVLYFYGNGENSSARALRLLKEGMTDAFPNCNIAMLDYPSYGKTEGDISAESLRKFGLAAYDCMAARSDVDKDKIILFGYSLGTGIANYVASERDAAGLMLMAPYANGCDLYNGFINVFYGPLRLLVSYDMDAEEYAKRVGVVPLLMASRDDEFVSFASSQTLSNAYPMGCDFRAFDGMAHNDFWKSDAVLSCITQYIEGATAK